MNTFCKIMLSGATLLSLTACNVEYTAPLCTAANRKSNLHYEKAKTFNFMTDDFKKISGTAEIINIGEGLYSSGGQTFETCEVSGKSYLQANTTQFGTYVISEIVAQASGVSINRVVMDYETAFNSGLNPQIIERPIPNQKASMLKSFGFLNLAETEKVLIVNVGSSAAMKNLIPLTFRFGIGVLQE